MSIVPGRPPAHRCRQFFVEFDIGFISAMTLERGKTNVAHDAEKPGTTVFAAEGSVKAEGAQGGFLHDIPGVVLGCA